MHIPLNVKPFWISCEVYVQQILFQITISFTKEKKKNEFFVFFVHMHCEYVFCRWTENIEATNEKSAKLKSAQKCCKCHNTEWDGAWMQRNDLKCKAKNRHEYKPTHAHSHTVHKLGDLVQLPFAVATFALCSYRNFIRFHVYRLHLPWARSNFSCDAHFILLTIHYLQNAYSRSWTTRPLSRINIVLIGQNEKDQFSVFSMSFHGCTEWSLSVVSNSFDNPEK